MKVFISVFVYISGKLKTTARWMRDFVDNHPDYKHDSVVTEKINYDLLWKFTQISNGKIDVPELILVNDTKTTDNIPAAVSKADAYLNHKNPHSFNGLST